MLVFSNHRVKAADQAPAGATAGLLEGAQDFLLPPAGEDPRLLGPEGWRTGLGCVDISKGKGETNGSPEGQLGPIAARVVRLGF